jgi:PAS domain-containing protein
MNVVCPDKVKKNRARKGWTQEHLANIAGLSYRTIQRIEKDGRCSLDSKMALSAAFGVNFVELLAEESSLLDHFFEMRFVQDGAGNYTSLKIGDPNLLALPADQIVGKNCADILPPSLSNQILQAIDDLKSGAKSIEFDYSLALSAGPQFFRAKIIQSAPDSFLSVITEIDQQKASEKKLLKNEALLGMLADTFKSGAWEVDLATSESFWTQQVFDIYEIDKTPSITEGISFYAPEARPIIQQAFENLSASGEAYDLELPFITATGKNLWVRVSGWPVYHNDIMKKVSGVIQDITHLKTPQTMT